MYWQKAMLWTRHDCEASGCFSLVREGFSKYGKEAWLDFWISQLWNNLPLHWSVLLCAFPVPCLQPRQWWWKLAGRGDCGLMWYPETFKLVWNGLFPDIVWYEKTCAHLRCDHFFLLQRQNKFLEDTVMPFVTSGRSPLCKQRNLCSKGDLSGGWGPWDKNCPFGWKFFQVTMHCSLKLQEIFFLCTSKVQMH